MIVTHESSSSRHSSVSQILAGTFRTTRVLLQPEDLLNAQPIESSRAARSPSPTSAKSLSLHKKQKAADLRRTNRRDQPEPFSVVLAGHVEDQGQTMTETVPADSSSDAEEQAPSSDEDQCDVHMEIHRWRILKMINSGTGDSVDSAAGSKRCLRPFSDNTSQGSDSHRCLELNRTTRPIPVSCNPQKSEVILSDGTTVRPFLANWLPFQDTDSPVKIELLCRKQDGNASDMIVSDWFYKKVDPEGWQLSRVGGEKCWSSTLTQETPTWRNEEWFSDAKTGKTSVGLKYGNLPEDLSEIVQGTLTHFVPDSERVSAKRKREELDQTDAGVDPRL